MFFVTKRIGIDLGSKNIRAALLLKKGSYWHIKQLDKIENPLNTTLIERDDERKILTECLKKLTQQLPCKKVVLGIPSEHIIFRNLQFPTLSVKELREAVYWESRDFSSIFNGEYIWDFQVIEKQPNNLCVLLAAVEKNLVMEYVDMVENSGLYLQALDVYPLARTRLFKTIKKSGSVAFIDIGFSNIEAMIVKNGRLILNRSLDLSVCHLNNLISEYGFSSFKEPELYQRQVTAFLGKIQDFTQEISRLFELYHVRSKSKDTPEIVLTGNGGKLLPIKDILQSYFKTSVITENELKYKFENRFSEKGIDHMEFSNSIGFAMRV